MSLMYRIYKVIITSCICLITNCSFLFTGSDNQYKANDTDPEILQVKNNFQYINHITNEDIKKVLFVMVIVQEKDIESNDKKFIDSYKQQYLNYLTKKGISTDNILIINSEIKLSRGKYDFQTNEENISHNINKDIVNNRNIKYVIKTYFTYHYLYCYIISVMNNNISNKYIMYNPCEVMKLSNDIDEENIKNQEVKRFINNMSQFDKYYTNYDFNALLTSNARNNQILILNLDKKEKKGEEQYHKYFKDHNLHLDEEDLEKIKNSKNDYILWNKYIDNTFCFNDFNSKDFIVKNEQYLDDFYFKQ